MAVFTAGSGLSKHGPAGNLVFTGRPEVGKLKEGMGKLLGYYPHLSGRVKEDGGISFTNEGVPIMVIDNPGWRLEDLYQRGDFTNIAEMTTAIKPARLMKGLGTDKHFFEIPYKLE